MSDQLLAESPVDPTPPKGAPMSPVYFTLPLAVFALITSLIALWHALRVHRPHKAQQKAYERLLRSLREDAEDLKQVFDKINSTPSPTRASKAKYILHPGFVHTADGDRLFITAHALCALYRIPMEDCVVDGPQTQGLDLTGKTRLFPRSDGNYILPVKKV